MAGLAALCLAVGAPVHAQGEPSAEELAKLTQNPIANLISVPLQNNTNFNVGPENGTQNILNIQPVIPFSLSQDWNLITRTILPIVTQPAFTPDESSTTGLGDLQLSGFLSPSRAGGLIWGAGAILQAPTHTSDRLGNDRWGLGPTAVVLRLEPGSPWVFGALVNNVWSVGSGSDPSYNNLLIQPFVNYNFPGGVYVNSVPIITADWNADSDQRWTVPLGAGIGKIVRFGRLPVNMQLGGYYNVVRPDDGPDWQLRAQVQFMFPK
jgi:hypothetical protein